MACRPSPDLSFSGHRLIETLRRSVDVTRTAIEGQPAIGCSRCSAAAVLVRQGNGCRRHFATDVFGTDAHTRARLHRFPRQVWGASSPAIKQNPWTDFETPRGPKMESAGRASLCRNRMVDISC